MRNGISIAGNLIVDITYPINMWPKESELANITGAPTRSIGGAVCNTICDLARLSPELPLKAIGMIGNDSEGKFIIDSLSKHKNIDLSALKTSGTTSYTWVMSVDSTKTRTFIHNSGSNAEFDESCIDFEAIDSKIFHIGYILLLDALDKEDDKYGTKMARLLHHAKECGLETSIDVVSESGERYIKYVIPALKYTDYCIINELEAQATTGITLRTAENDLITENIPAVLKRLHELGVSKWAVIHCPEGGFGMDEVGNFISLPSLVLPKGFIKGTVGAGDAFCAGVLMGAHDGMSLEESVKLGICTAAASLSAPGGSEGVQSKAEVMALAEKYGKF